MATAAVPFDLATFRAVRAERARRSLAEFVKQSWPIIEPTTPLIWNWHLDVVCEHVRALFQDRLAKQNLLLNVPPGSMKSTIVSVCLPAWIWIQPESQHPKLGPSWRGLFAAGNTDVAMRDSLKCRDILDSDWYRSLFAQTWGFTRDQNAKGHYKNTATGFRRAMTAGQRITGSRGDALLIDDPNDAAEVYSKPSRDQIIRWYRDAFANRLTDLRTGKRLLIMQRLHDDDLAGWLLKNEPDLWEVVIIRQEYERPTKKDPDYNRVTSIGWSDPRTEPGVLFFPQRFDAVTLAAERLRLGSMGWSGQHQQRVAPAEGGILKMRYWRYWVPQLHPLGGQLDDYGHVIATLPGTFERTIDSWDFSFGSKTSDASYVVGQTWSRKGSRAFLRRQYRKRCGFPEMVAACRVLNDWSHAEAIYVEKKANGPAVLDTLSGEIPGMVAVEVDKDKVARAHGSLPRLEAGNYHLPHPTLDEAFYEREDGTRANWVDEFREECRDFPNAGTDDQVDAFTQADAQLYHGQVFDESHFARGE